MLVMEPIILSVTVMLVRVMLPQLLTTPLTVCRSPNATVLQFFVTARHGVTQMGQATEVEFVTKEFGPPIAVLSRPLTVIVLVPLPAQISPREGVKLPWNCTTCPAAK